MKAKIILILRIIPFFTLILIPFINVYYTLIFFVIIWFAAFFAKKQIIKAIPEKEIENIAQGITRKNELNRLYRELSFKVHPDRNHNNKDLAEKYSQLLNEHRYNYNKIKELEQVINKLF